MHWPKTGERTLVTFDLSANYEVRILSGLPYAGTPYHDISTEPGKLLIRAGLVAQISPRRGTPWIGNFESGPGAATYLDGIAHTPDPDVALVLAEGQGYFVRADDPTTWKTLKTCFASDIILLREPEWFIVVDDIGLSCYTATGGLRWGGRLVVDDLRVTEVDGNIIRGFGWSGAMEESDGESDLHFEVDAVTGRCTYMSALPIELWWDYPPGRRFDN